MSARRARIEQWLEQCWSGQRRPPWLLVLLSWVYHTLLLLRRGLWRIGVFRAQRVACPVVVVGNLSVGGSGKTPLVIWMVRWLATQGLRVGVISRGYGRESMDCREVFADSDPRQCGDEPVLIAAETGAPVAVSRSRVQAARLLLGRHELDLLICDDGLQHWPLRRDIEVLIEDARALGNRRLLPAGPLRAPAHWVDAQALRLHRGTVPKAGQGYRLHEQLGAVRALRGTEVRSLSDFAGQQLDALAGIARPARFFEALERHGLRLRHRVAPGDHGQADAGSLSRPDGLALLMTAKDAVKYRDQKLDNAWSVDLDLTPEPAFAEALLARLSPLLAGEERHR